MIGQFFTPEIVAKCMYGLAGTHEGDRVIDPSCGDGSFLKSAPGGVELHACEIDPDYAGMVRKLIGGNLVEGDALSSLAKDFGSYDLAIGNPPFSAQASLEKRSHLLKDYELGVGRKSQCLEVLFIELFWKLLKPGGRMAIILPDGPVSNKPFKYVRRWLLCRTHVEAIISLPRGIFQGTTAKTNLLVARRLPVSLQPCREPTALLECKELGALKPLRLVDWKKEEPRWKQAVLADSEDWRPEAHSSATENDPTSVRLGSLFRLRTGHALYGAKREFFEQPGDERVVLIRAKNLKPEGGLQFDKNCVFISRSGEMFCEQSVVKPGELLFVRVGAGCCGRTALVPSGLKAQADDWIHVLTRLVEVDLAATVAWFNSEEGRKSVRRLAKGVGTVSVSKSSLAELRIPARLQKIERRDDHLIA